MSDRLLLAYGLILLLAAGLGTVIWSNVRQSHRRTYQRRRARERKKAAAAGRVKTALEAHGRDRA